MSRKKLTPVRAVDNREKVRTIIKLLRKEYPNPSTALNYRSPFEMLVATMLSAQSTDAQVNRVTANLFRKYKTVQDYADASADDFRNDLKSINFFNNKARNIQTSARMIIGQFRGKVPNTMEDLTSLPGVARKTANIVLSNVYGISEGIAVDTHVKRLSYRLGLSKHKDPVKIEKDLMEITEERNWGIISNLLILHGRRICSARNPEHHECVLNSICPSREI